MTPEQIAALIEYLKNIGEFAVSKGFELAIRQVYANAAVAGLWVVASLFMLIPTVWCFKQARIAFNDEDSWQSQQDAEVWGILVGVMLSIVFTMAFLANLTRLIQYLINPEWYAMDLLFKLIS